MLHLVNLKSFMVSKNKLMMNLSEENVSRHHSYKSEINKNATTTDIFDKVFLTFKKCTNS